jgi:hypothetical protein
MFKVSIAVFVMAVSGAANAVSFISPITSSVFSSAEMLNGPANIVGYGIGLGQPSSPQAVTVSGSSNSTFQFELLDPNPSSLNSNFWVDLFSPTGFSSNYSLTGTYSFSTQPNYLITGVYASMGGIYTIEGSGAFNANAGLSEGFLEVDSIAVQLHPAGTNLPWSSSSGLIAFPAGRQSINGNFNFLIVENPTFELSAARQPTFSRTIVRGETLGPYYGPSIFVTVEQVVSAVPEPGEWAMMLAGLGMVSFIAKRRKQAR